MVAGSNSTVFINEIHYDNNGPSDIAEFVEIANTGNTDLTGWSVVLYDGGTPYATFALSGSAAYTQITTVLQNGPRDGLALVNASNVVVQLLSYEGVFTAISGVATGLLSTDIMQVERGNGTVGNTLQLVGTGKTYGDFTWAAPAAATGGAQNTAQAVIFPDVNINGSNSVDTMFGSDGGRDFIVAKRGNDVIYGRGGDDYILGNRDDDTIYGGDGNDILYGGAENDILYGGAGNDRIHGDKHNDQLFGGTGTDTFVFKKGFGSDLLSDFELGIDKLEFAKKVFKDFASVQAGAAQDGTDVLISDGLGNVLRIEDVLLISLDSSHFFFV